MTQVIEALTTFITIIIFIQVIRNSSQFCAMIPITYVFFFTMVLPIWIETFAGTPKTSYRILQYSYGDLTTTIIYCVFIVFGSYTFYRELLYEIRLHSISYADFSMSFAIDHSSNNIRIFEIISVVCCLILPIAWLLAPDPIGYLEGTGILASSVNAAYQTNVMVKCQNFAALGAIVNKYLDDTDRKDMLVIRIITYVLIAIVNGKRTLVMMVIGACLLFDIVREAGKRSTRIKLIISVIIVGIYFVGYSYITGKYLFNTNWRYVISEYFFRDNVARVAIYSSMHPDRYRLLDGVGKSIIYNLFYFIPRSVWPSKPYPFPIYYFSAMMGSPTLLVADWRFQTSIYGEFIANFGLVGIFIVVFFIKYMARFFDKRKPLTLLVGVALFSILEMYEYSDLLKEIAIILLLLVISEKVKFVIRKPSAI